MALEVGGDFRVARRDLASELVGGERHDRELDLVIAPPVLLLEILVGDRQPVGQRRAQLLDCELPPDVVLEIARRHRRPLESQQLLIPLLADERAVLLKRWNRENPMPHLRVIDGDAEPARLCERGAFVHHLLEDLLLHAELLEQLLAHLAAVGGAIRLELRLIGPPEFVRRDVLAVDPGDGFAGGGVGAVAAQEVRNVEDDEGQHDEAQAPFEPAHVPTHPIQHGHKEPRALTRKP